MLFSEENCEKNTTKFSEEDWKNVVFRRGLGKI